MKKLFGLILFLLILLVLWRPSTVAAEEEWPASVQVSQNSATSNFPNNIKFEFRAKANNGSPNFKKAELSFRLVGEVATSVRLVSLGSGPEISVSYQQDTQKDYIPPGTRLTYFWTLYDEADKAYRTPPLEWTYLDNRFKFKELKSGVVSVRWYQGDDSFGQAILSKATATIEKLGKLYQIEPKNPINITVYPDSRTLFTALPPNTAEWVGGQATPTLGTIVLAIAPGNLTEVGRSVPHEVSHQVVYQATLNPYNVPPTWLDEGLAVASQDQVEGFLIETFERAVDKHTLFPLRVLNGSFPADSQESYLAYAESVKVVQYIQSKYGQAALAKMLAAFKEGVSYDEAVRRGLGIGLDDLDREWKQSIGYPLSPEATAIPTTTPAPLAALAPATDPTLTPAPTAVAIAPQPQVENSPTPAVVASVVTPAPVNSSSNSLDKFFWPLLAGAGLLICGGLGIILAFWMKQKRG